MNETKAKTIMALARLEALAAKVAAQAMQAHVALDVGGIVPRYADQLRLGHDCERVAELWRDVEVAVVAKKVFESDGVVEFSMRRTTVRLYRRPEVACESCGLASDVIEIMSPSHGIILCRKCLLAVAAMGEVERCDD